MPTAEDLRPGGVSRSQYQAGRSRQRYDSGVPRLALVTTVGVVLVRVVATANQALTGSATIDDVALGDYDAVLLTAQTDDTENGVWHKQAGAWLRSENPVGLGLLYSVQEGTTNGLTLWRCTTLAWTGEFPSLEFALV